MKKLLLIGGIIILPLVLISCAAQPAIGVSEEAPLSTSLPQTNTPEPTATATLALTPTPEGQIFRDDFTGQLRPEWSWENENPSRWTLTDDGWLQIIGEDQSLLGAERQSNLLWTTLPEGDFAISVHLQAQPVVNFQQATIYIYENLGNFIALDLGYCGPCGGKGIYMDYKIDKDWGKYMQLMNVKDLYLKLVSQENVITGYYTVEPNQWQRLGRLGNFFQFKRVGLGVSNVDQKHTSSDDLIGMFDYFEITRP
jgi:hypothetical protein